MRSLKSVGDGLGVGKDLAEVSPDNLVELVGRGVARGAIFAFSSTVAVSFASADVVLVGAQRPGTTGEAALTAADQGPQQVAVCLVVAARKRLVVRELLGRQLKLLLSHDGGYGGYRDPFLRSYRYRRLLGVADWLGGRAPYPWRAVAHAPGLDLPRVDGFC